MKKIIFLNLLVLLVLSACGGSKKVAEKPVQPKKVEPPVVVKDKPVVKNEQKNLDDDIVKYITRFQNIAKREMKEYGIPVSVTLAQGILESQSGQSRLAKEGNNHFGIKCHKDWKGKTILHDDNKAQECFRKYEDPEDSYKDHSKFLAQRKRYAFLFRLPKTDYEAWARGLKKAGYATDPTYPEKLIYIIEKYDLGKLDKEVLREMSVKVEDKEEEKTGNKKKKFIYEVKQGETLFTISRKFNIPVKDIQRINNLNEFDIYEGQILVLTENDGDEQDSPTQEDTQAQPDTSVNQSDDTSGQNNQPVKTTPVEKILKAKKKTVYTGAYSLHTVKESETLSSIAKKYHISVEDLKKVNALSGDEISKNMVLKIPYNEVKGAKTANNQPESPEVPGAEYHIVQPGETLYRIHVNYGVSVEKLRKLNHLKGNYIKVGQKLRIK